MDFDIGNILYVVITLVAIIASLLGKKKKPASKDAKPGFFDNLEQVLLEINEGAINDVPTRIINAVHHWRTADGEIEDDVTVVALSTTKWKFDKRIQG